MRIIAGRFKGKKLLSPTDNKIRPTSDRVRESIFNILASHLNNNFSNIRVLDLFAGTGAMGLEAISRGVDFVCFIDNNIKAKAIIRSNIEEFGIAKIAKSLKADAINLSEIEKFEPFNLIFIDPPYGQGLGEKALTNALKNGWIAKNAIIILEEKSDIKIKFSDDLELFSERKYGGTKIYFLNS